MVEGPPVADTGADWAGVSIMAMENPPNGLELSVMALCYHRSTYPLGVSSELAQGGQDVTRQELDPTWVVDVPNIEDDVLGAGIGQLAEPVDDLRRCL